MGITIIEETKEERNNRLKEYKIQLENRLIIKARELREATLEWKMKNGLNHTYNHCYTKAAKLHDKIFPIDNLPDEVLSDTFLLAFKNNDKSFFLPHEDNKIYKDIYRLRADIPFSPSRKKTDDYKRVITSLISKFKVSQDERSKSPELLKFLGITLDDILYNYREIKSLQLTVESLLQEQWFINIIIENAKEGIPISKNETVKRRRFHIKQLKKKREKLLQNDTYLLFQIYSNDHEISKIKSGLDKKLPKFYYEISSIHFSYFSNVCLKLKQKNFNPLFIRNKTQLKLIIQKYVFLYNNIFEQEQKDYREERNRVNNRKNKPKSTEKYKKYIKIQMHKAEGKNIAEINRLEGYARQTIYKYWKTDTDIEEFSIQNANKIQ